ncbi:MAG: ABC transporter substrate-binding protein [Saprospiraceae bacterium]
MTRQYTDQMRRKVSIPFPPKRIISLVPSQTELLYDLGLEESIVGLTKFCIHPDGLKKRKTIVGGTKNLHFDKIAALQPDLIIGNKEENQRDQIEPLMEQYPVWMSDISNLEDALEMISSIGQITNKEGTTQDMIEEIEEDFADHSMHQQIKKTAYFIWRQPYMVAAGGTFIDDMMQRAGFENVFGNVERYPEVTADDITKANPELIFLSSEPYPFKEKHIAELKEICPQATISLVDGELFSWYGSRLLLSASYFAKLQKQF